MRGVFSKHLIDAFFEIQDFVLDFDSTQFGIRTFYIGTDEELGGFVVVLQLFVGEPGEAPAVEYRAYAILIDDGLVVGVAQHHREFLSGSGVFVFGFRSDVTADEVALHAVDKGGDVVGEFLDFLSTIVHLAHLVGTVLQSLVEVGVGIVELGGDILVGFAHGSTHGLESLHDFSRDVQSQHGGVHEVHHGNHLLSRSFRTVCCTHSLLLFSVLNQIN